MSVPSKVVVMTEDDFVVISQPAQRKMPPLVGSCVFPAETGALSKLTEDGFLTVSKKMWWQCRCKP
jgi:hypothetical protein